MQFVYGQDEAIARFVAELNGRDFRGVGSAKSIGIINDDGMVIFGALFFNYDKTAGVIESTIACIDRRAFTRETFRRVFEYVFINCGCQMIYSRLRADNEHWLSQLARLNFNFTLIPRMFGREEDGVIATLTDDQWLDSKLARRVYRDVKKEAA